MQQDPASRVSAPAIGLMVAGGLSALVTVVWMGLMATVGGSAMLAADPELRDALPGLGVLMMFGLLKLILDVLTMYAGLQMRQLKSWALSMSGAVVAMLPCSVCCLLGLPMGIWAVIVLIDDDVKRAFDGGGSPPGGYDPPPGGYGPPPAGPGA